MSLPTCAPVGSMGRPTLGHRFCLHCPAVLHPVPIHPHYQGRLDDWTYVDESGRSGVDHTPQGLKDDPRAWWAELARTNIGRYSSLKAAMDLGHFSFYHPHHPGRSAEACVFIDPPFCCGSPMYAGATGWYCRVNRQRFTYLEG